MSEFLAELRVPADPAFIPAAKRVGTSIGTELGFSLDEIDELGIAVAQACDSTIEACEDFWGQDSGALLKLTYTRTVRGIAVEVEAVGPRHRHVERATAQSAPRLPVGSTVPRRDVEAQRIAQEMIRVFVDDFRSQVDASRGSVRFRMVKYLIG